MGFMKRICENIGCNTLTKRTVQAIESDLIHSYKSIAQLSRVWDVSETTIRTISRGKHKHSTKEL